MERTLYVEGAPTPVRPRPRPRRRRGGWAVPIGLVALGLVPMLAGSLRLVELAGGPAALHPDARFTATPLPVVVHVASSIVFTLAGAFQVSDAARRQWPAWHRVAGRVLVPLGLASGGSGLWLTIGLPWLPGDGWSLHLLRLVFGGGMVAAALLGVGALVRRRYRDHGHWMLRAYALGAAAGTQAVLSLPVAILAGTPTGGLRAALLGAGWVVNLAVAEWVIRRGGRRRARVAT